MTLRAAAGFIGNAQVAGIYEPYELGTLPCQQGPRTLGDLELSVLLPFAGKLWAHVCRVLFGRDRIAAMTGCASEPQSVFAMIELIQSRGGTEPVHRFDLVMTFQTAF